ncbi:MAG: HTH domain-containing protein [Parvimonas sp.]|uniref:HTH domain-containing protein n=1 Tax=Parvimonas sp. TaxID=1944660 RepID=UPI002A75D4CF|nr:HTH domain-containing protein [Parvimonas sp.]MDY3051171.1 HTH domain-containing protein [Parvimonas sp.]
MELQEKILNLLKNEDPLKSGEIAEKLGVDKASVDKKIKKLKTDEKIISPKRCFYSVEK